MFWDHIAGVYDLFERVYNNKVIEGTARICADLMDGNDNVLECACGTGLITTSTAPRTRSYVATDFSDKMLQKCKKKMKGADNIRIESADITALQYGDDSFDKVIAGNVIHLLDDPSKAMDELKRVVKKGGTIIIPTYINKNNSMSAFLVRVFNKLGADFKRQFDTDSYKRFISGLGFENASYEVAEGKMPCAVAIIKV